MSFFNIFVERLKAHYVIIFIQHISMVNCPSASFRCALPRAIKVELFPARSWYVKVLPKCFHCMQSSCDFSLYYLNSDIVRQACCEQHEIFAWRDFDVAYGNGVDITVTISICDRKRLRFYMEINFNLNFCAFQFISRHFSHLSLNSWFVRTRRIKLSRWV